MHPAETIAITVVAFYLRPAYLVLERERATARQAVNAPPYVHLVRAVLAIGLAAFLPVLLYTRASPGSELLRAYTDALAAVVAFYFGATSEPAQ